MPTLWIVAPDLKVVGLHYGHELRREQLLAVVVKRSDGLSASASGAVVLTGKLPTPELIGACQQVILLNPPPPPDAGAFLDTFVGRRIVVAWGEFRDELGRGGWERLARSYPTMQVLDALGAFLYLTYWGRLVKGVEATAAERVGKGDGNVTFERQENTDFSLTRSR